MIQKLYKALKNKIKHFILTSKKTLNMQDLKKIKLGNYEILIPPGHIFSHSNLPIWYDYFPIALIMKSIANIKEKHFIDIGANVGDTLALIKTYDEEIPVTCIEPSELFFEIFLKNSAQFKNITSYKKFITPKDLRNKITFSSGNQTGVTKINAEQELDSNKYEFVDMENIFKKNCSNILKTDTDGFDLHIVKDCIKVAEENNFDMPLIYFEGPAEEDFINCSVSEWYELFEILINSNYELLFLQNNGLPYANASNNLKAAKSILFSLCFGQDQKRPICHYFDVIAYKENLANDKLDLTQLWPSEWTSENF